MSSMSFFKKGKTTASEQSSTTPLFDSLEESIEYIKSQLNYTDDLLIKDVTWNDRQGKIVYINSMIDTDQFQRIFLSPLTEMRFNEQMNNLVASPEMNQSNNLDDVINGMLQGDCAVLIENDSTCYSFNIIQSNSRSAEEPDSEKVVRGSHMGFVENFEVNLNLIRGRLKNRHLKIEYITLGTEENATIALIYLHNIADPEVVQTMRKRINAVKNNSAEVFSPGFLKEDIADTVFTPFQQLLFTERPDRLQANLVEGRIAILNEGSSDVMVAPISFFSLFQSPEDYNLDTFMASIIRVLRLFCFFGALLLPSLYIAIISFHFEFIPYDLIPLVKGTINNIPFSPLMEALIMAITIELIREASMRLPTPIGGTIGIVGGLIIGESIVDAGIVSNFMVIVIALTAIMSFCLPSYELGNTVRLLSIPMMLSASILGFVGIVFIFMLIMIHLCSLESFGKPYLSPLAPFHFKELKDTIIRLPNWVQKTRPKDLETKKAIKRGKARRWD